MPTMMPLLRASWVIAGMGLVACTGADATGLEVRGATEPLGDDPASSSGAGGAGAGTTGADLDPTGAGPSPTGASGSSGASDVLAGAGSASGNATGAAGGGAGASPSGSGTDASGGAVGSGEAGTPAGGALPVLWLTLPERSDPNDIGEDDEFGSLRVIEGHGELHASPAGFATAPATLETPINMHVRGRSSTFFDKKSFALELEDATGEQVKLPLLGMPRESDWVLHGPYSDKTYLRNALMYWLGSEIYRSADGTIERGRWSPRTRFVEVYINGRYWGVYVVVEKIKADSDRVDVDRPAFDADLGDVSGGYIIRREGGGNAADGEDWVSSENELVYTFHYPRVDDLSADQREYIQDYVDGFESMMRSDSWNDPELGYPAWLDVTSTVDYFLAMEWSNNVDGYFKSVYMVKHADSLGGKLAFGPLWDFDIALGNADYRGGDDVQNWVHQTLGAEGTEYFPPGAVEYIPPYVTRLWEDPSFRRALRCRWEALRAGPLALERIESQIGTWVEVLEEAERRDHARWPVIGVPLWPNPVVWGTYAQEIEHLEHFMRQRFAFLDAELAELAPGACLE